MHTNKRFLSLLALLLAQPVTMGAFSVCNAPCAFVSAWYKAVTCRALSRSDCALVTRSAAVTIMAVPFCSLIYAAVSLHKLDVGLRKAIQEHKNEQVRHLVPRKMKINLGVLLWTALDNNNNEALKILLEHGAAPDTTLNILKGTPLCVAMKRNNFEAAHLLLDHGADPEGGSFYAYKNEAIAQKIQRKIEEKKQQAKTAYSPAERLGRRFKFYNPSLKYDPSKIDFSHLLREREEIAQIIQREQERLDRIFKSTPLPTNLFIPGLNKTKKEGTACNT